MKRLFAALARALKAAFARAAASSAWEYIEEESEAAWEATTHIARGAGEFAAGVAAFPFAVIGSAMRPVPDAGDMRQAEADAAMQAKRRQAEELAAAAAALDPSQAPMRSYEVARGTAEAILSGGTAPDAGHLALPARMWLASLTPETATSVLDASDADLRRHMMGINIPGLPKMPTPEEIKDFKRGYRKATGSEYQEPIEVAVAQTWEDAYHPPRFAA